MTPRRTGDSAEIARVLLEQRAAVTAPHLVHAIGRARGSDTFAPGAAATDVGMRCGAGRPRLVRLADLRPKPIAWLWRHRLVAGTLNLLEGRQGIGKSTLACDLIARVTRGWAFPDGAATMAGPVLLVGPEDSVEQTLLPRLTAAGADLKLVHLFEGAEGRDGEATGVQLPRDMTLLAQAIDETGAILVFIDALNDLLGGKTDMNSDAQVRAVLTPVRRLAERTGAAVLATRHFGKSARASAVNAGLGSVAYSALARAVLQVYEDPDVPGRILLARAKCNVAPPVPTLAFALLSTASDREHDGPAVVTWQGSDPRSAEELQAALRDTASVEPSADLDAAAWLREVLGDGPADRREVLRLGRDAGFSERTIDRAGQKVGVSRQTTGFGREKRSVWSLPAAMHPPDSAQSRQFRQGGERDGNGGIGETGGIVGDETHPTGGPLGR
jgi:hypothetical protein